jgi:hypothetical protein
MAAILDATSLLPTGIESEVAVDIVVEVVLFSGRKFAKRVKQISGLRAEDARPSQTLGIYTLTIFKRRPLYQTDI